MNSIVSTQCSEFFTTLRDLHVRPSPNVDFHSLLDTYVCQKARCCTSSSSSRSSDKKGMSSPVVRSGPLQEREDIVRQFRISLGSIRTHAFSQMPVMLKGEYQNCPRSFCSRSQPFFYNAFAKLKLRLNRDGKRDGNLDAVLF